MIQKINQDFDSNIHRKNMTNTQKRNDSNLKEGVIVNSFVKDPLMEGLKAGSYDSFTNTFTPLNETIDTLIISNSKIDLPSKLFENDEKVLIHPAGGSGDGGAGFLRK